VKGCFVRDHHIANDRYFGVGQDLLHDPPDGSIHFSMGSSGGSNTRRLDPQRTNAGVAACLGYRSLQSDPRLRFPETNDIAAGSRGYRACGRFVPDSAGRLGSSAIDPKEKRHIALVLPQPRAAM
jgi:hypothetical protein